MQRRQVVDRDQARQVPVEPEEVESVANKVFVPAGIDTEVRRFGWDDALWNWLLAGVGTLVGAVVFVATSYWYLFLRDRPEKPTAAEEPAERA